MADFWLSFRIRDNATYQRRYDAVNESGDGFWDGPTSFICIRTTETIDALGQTLAAAINPTCDLVVIREIGKDNTRYAGEPGDGFLAFFPKAKKL